MDTQSYLPVQPGVGMEESFLSLDDILLSHERLPIRTECAFPRLGFLEKSSDSQDIPEVGKVSEGKCMKRRGSYKCKYISLEVTVSITSTPNSTVCCVKKVRPNLLYWHWYMCVKN